MILGTGYKIEDLVSYLVSYLILVVIFETWSWYRAYWFYSWNTSYTIWNVCREDDLAEVDISRMSILPGRVSIVTVSLLIWLVINRIQCPFLHKTRAPVLLKIHLWFPDIWRRTCPNAQKTDLESFDQDREDRSQIFWPELRDFSSRDNWYWIHQTKTGTGWPRLTGAIWQIPIWHIPIWQPRSDLSVRSSIQLCKSWDKVGSSVCDKIKRFQVR